MEEAALPMPDKYSPWTATQATWTGSLDGIDVKVAPAAKPAEERELSERLKPFDTALDPQALVRFVYD